MPNRSVIVTDKAPAAIGTYSQAIKTGDTVYLSGQIALNPAGELVNDSVEAEVRQVFANLSAVCEAAGGNLQQVVKFTIYLTDLANFALVNDTMIELLQAPYPARATLGIASLPKGARVEIDAVMVID